MKRVIIIGAIGLFALLLMGYGCSKRNSFVDLNETVVAQWHQVESQYQRRLDLIPNIVKTLKQFRSIMKIGMVKKGMKKILELMV